MFVASTSVSNDFEGVDFVRGIFARIRGCTKILTLTPCLARRNRSCFLLQTMAEQKQKNKPSDSPFKQQRLKAWQPILTPNWVVGTFIMIGVVFLPIGIALLSTSNSVSWKAFFFKIFYYKIQSSGSIATFGMLFQRLHRFTPPVEYFDRGLECQNIFVTKIQMHPLASLYPTHPPPPLLKLKRAPFTRSTTHHSHCPFIFFPPLPLNRSWNKQ